MTLLLPTFAQGQSFDDLIGKGKGHLCETTGLGCPESVDFKDLIKRDGLYYKKFSDVPFNGKVTGQCQGTLKNGQWNGPFAIYHKNGQLNSKGTYKNGKEEGSWFIYRRDGNLAYKYYYKDGIWDGPIIGYNQDGTGDKEFSGIYKNRVKVSD